MKTAADTMESSRIQDLNGFWEVRDNPISKVGVFMYSGRKIAPYLPPDQLFAVYRPAEELADPECAASFRLMPWIDNHPKKLLGDPKEGFSDPGKSVIAGVLGEQIYFDDADLQLKANLKLFNFTHDERIDAGKRELSIGYRCIYVRESGEYNGVPYEFVQRKLRGNHIASVGSGRSGPDIAVMDSAVEITDDFMATFDNAEYVNMAQTKPTKPTMGKKIALISAPQALKNTASYMGVLSAYAADAAEEAEKKGDSGGGEFKQLASLLEQVQPLMAAIAALPVMGDTAAVAAMPEEEIAMDKEPEGAEGEAKPKDGAAEAKPESETKPKEGAAMDAAEITRIATTAATAAANAAVQELLKPVTGKLTGAMDAAEMHAEFQRKNKIVEAVKPFVGVFDHAEMTSDQVAVYAADKLKLGAPKGQEMTALSAYLVGRKPPRATPATQSGMDASETTAKGAQSLRDKMQGKAAA